jgi:hypothetical protein
MARHRTFNADKFLDKLQGHEPILRGFLGLWDDGLDLDVGKVDVPGFKAFLVDGDGASKDDLLENLYRVYDLCDERGHEDLAAACRDQDIEPDPTGELPVECLSLVVRAEHEDAFNLAYDRNTLWKAERFSVYRGPRARKVSNPDAAVARFQKALAECFKDDKKSDRVLVRHYVEGSYVNVIVYHEKRTKAELVFKGPRRRPEVAPSIFRPAQQDFISYDSGAGQVEIEARFENEEARLRQCFAECCLGDAEFFEADDAAERFNLGRIAEDDFEMAVDGDDEAYLTELHFRLRQKYGPVFMVRSKNTMETLDTNRLRKRLSGGEVRKAVFKIVFPDDKRGKRVEITGANKAKFRRATHADDVFRYLRRWGIAVD